LSIHVPITNRDSDAGVTFAFAAMSSSDNPSITNNGTTTEGTAEIEANLPWVSSFFRDDTTNDLRSTEVFGLF